MNTSSISKKATSTKLREYLNYCIKRKIFEIRAVPIVEFEHRAKVNSVSFSNYGRFVATGSDDKVLRV
jgi:WD40 repeat protein